MSEFLRIIPNPQRGFCTGDIQISFEITKEGADLVVNHNGGMNDNGEIYLSGANPKETLEAVKGMIDGLTEVRSQLEKHLQEHEA